MYSKKDHFKRSKINSGAALRSRPSDEVGEVRGVAGLRGVRGHCDHMVALGQT